MPYFGPIIPPDSPLAVPDKNRLRVRILLFASLAIVCFSLVAVALQGCNRANSGTLSQAGLTNALPTFEVPPEVPGAVEVNPITPAQTTITRAKPVPPTFPGAQPYKIAKGDNLDAIAKRFHVALKALEDANPGLEPKRLQIDQVIQIPLGAVSGSNGVPHTGTLTSR